MDDKGKEKKPPFRWGREYLKGRKPFLVTAILTALAAILFASPVLTVLGQVTTGYKGTSVVSTTTHYSDDCVSYPEGLYFSVQPHSAYPYDEAANLSEEEYASLDYTTQFSIYREQVALNNPKQDQECTLFVPYSVIEEHPALKSGWLNNISYVYYPKAIYNDKDILANRVFLTDKPMSDSEFKKIAREGGFYSALYDEGIHDKDGSLNTKLGKALQSKATIKKMMTKENIAKAKKVMSYILNLKTENGKYVVDADSAIATWMVEGYNGISYSNWSKNWKNDFDMLKIDGFTNKEIKKALDKNAYSFNEYNLHQVDLMLCIYACVYGTGSTSEENWRYTLAWMGAAANEALGKTGLDHMYYYLSISMGVIAMGMNDSGSKQSQVCVYANCQDLLDLAYGLSRAGIPTKDKTVNQKSVTKGFPGYWPVGNANVGKFITTFNKEVIEDSKKKNKGATEDSIKKLPSYYNKYYDRLETAIKNADKKSYSLSESSSWHSRNIIQRLLGTIYTCDGKGNVKSQASTNHGRRTFFLLNYPFAHLPDFL